MLGSAVRKMVVASEEHSPDAAQPLSCSILFLRRFGGDRGTWLGVLLGLVMPLLSACIYPTYRHNMPIPWVENSRLLEAPFVLCELMVIVATIHCGFELRKIFVSLPRDCLVALALMMGGVWESTLFVSKAPALSIMISLSTIVHLLFACSVAFLIAPCGGQSIGRFFKGLAIGLLALVGLTFWRFALPPPLSQIPYHQIEWGSALPGFISVRHFGTWAGAIAALFAAAVLNRSGHGRWTWHELAYFLATLITVWSGTRAAVLAMALACAIMLVSQWRLPNLHMVARVAMLLGVALLVNETMLPHPDDSFLLFHSLRMGAADEFTSGREELWKATLIKWLQAPWFGWGSGSTFWEVDVGWPHTQPHNFVLQFLISWGVVGASGAIWLLGRATMAAQRRARAQPVVWPLNAMLYSLLIQACLEGMLHYPRFIMVIMALFAMILRLGQPKEQSQVTCAAPIVPTSFAPPTRG